jgi:hypothetical protein
MKPMSLPQMPLAPTWTSTCPGPGVGTSCVRSSAVPSPGRNTPCMVRAGVEESRVASAPEGAVVGAVVVMV